MDDLPVISPNKRKCFRLIENSSYWDELESRCRDYSGHLATLTSAKELSFAGKLYTNTARGCWVGGRGFNSTGGFSWKWSDNATHWNESISPRAPFHSNGSNSSCKGINLINTCTSVTNGQPTLVGERCNNSHEFICMLDIENKCYHLRRHKEYLIILAIVSGMILCTTLAVVIWLLAYRRSKRCRRSRKASIPSTSAPVTPSWKVFGNEELRPITKNFSEGNRLVGNAKTGGTYSGLLPDGTRVAVKRLKRSGFQRKKEFYSEIGRVTKLHYPAAVCGVRPPTMPGVTGWKCLFLGRTCLILKILGSLFDLLRDQFPHFNLEDKVRLWAAGNDRPQLTLRMPRRGKVNNQLRGGGNN
uniref:C-type lectin domain-containing protein n=1 Tax=Nelumbo nucifera TaxID=4432 RepID=A0A822XSV2_NELNU|nr:TPA_asm: hypothetical protein HUJ06_024943 [Nelumbo nucifera]